MSAYTDNKFDRCNQCGMKVYGHHQLCEPCFKAFLDKTQPKHIAPTAAPAQEADLTAEIGTLRDELDNALAAIASMVTVGTNMQEYVATLRAERDRALAALEELVACKELKDTARAMNCKARGAPGKVRAGMLDEYQRRQPLAWAAARALTRATTGDAGGE